MYFKNTAITHRIIYWVRTLSRRHNSSCCFFLTLLCFRLDLVSAIFIEDQSFDFFQTFRLKYLFISQTVHERDHTCHCSAFSVMQWTHKLRLPELTHCPLTLASLFFFLPPHPHLMFFTALLCADLKCLLASLAHSAFICLLHFYLILGGLSSSEGLFLSNWEVCISSLLLS